MVVKLNITKLLLVSVSSLFLLNQQVAAMPGAADVEKKVNRFVRANFSSSCLGRLDKYLSVLEVRQDEQQRVLGTSLLQARPYIAKAMDEIISHNQQDFLGQFEQLNRIIRDGKSQWAKTLMEEVFRPLKDLYERGCREKKAMEVADSEVAASYLQTLSGRGAVINPCEVMINFYEKWFRNYEARVKSGSAYSGPVIRPEASQQVAAALFGLMFGATSHVKAQVDDKSLGDTARFFKTQADVISSHDPGCSEEMIVGSETVARSIRNLALRMEIRRAGLGILPQLNEMRPDKKTLFVANKIFQQLTPQEVLRRLGLLEEAKKFAQKFSLSSDSQTLKELEEVLCLVKTLRSTDKAYLDYVRIAESCRSRGELVLSALNYHQSIVFAPDRLIRDSLVSRLLLILPDSFSGYLRWKEEIRQEYTNPNYLLGTIDDLMKEHKKLLALHGGYDSDIASLKQPIQRIWQMPDIIRTEHDIAEQRSISSRDSTREEQSLLTVPEEFSQLDEIRKMRADIRAKHAELKAKEESRAAAREFRAAGDAAVVANSCAIIKPTADVAQENAEMPIVAHLETNNYNTFSKFFLDKRGNLVTLSTAIEWESTTWQDMVDITPDALKRLIENLGGKSRSGKGSHSKVVIPGLQAIGSSIVLKNLIDPRLQSQTATVTGGREGFIPPYQVEQIRSKFMSLGYIPSTVSQER